MSTAERLQDLGMIQTAGIATDSFTMHAWRLDSFSVLCRRDGRTVESFEIRERGDLVASAYGDRGAAFDRLAQILGSGAETRQDARRGS